MTFSLPFPFQVHVLENYHNSGFWVTWSGNHGDGHPFPPSFSSSTTILRDILASLVLYQYG